MAQALRSAYPGLFQTYPDANQKDAEALRNFFSAHTKVSEGTLAFIVSTFKTLCELGDFAAPEASGLNAPLVVGPLPASNITGQLDPERTMVTTGPAININIELQIPATENAEIYDKFFAAMKKHLFSE
jgi:hypothetical protein